MLKNIVISTSETLTQLGDDECALLVYEPLLSSVHPLQKKAKVLSVGFHDIVPNALFGHALAGLTPFDKGMARKILEFVAFYDADPLSWTLRIACPHGRARGNSLAAGLARLYPNVTVEGSVIPESVNSYVTGLLTEGDRYLLVAK